MSNNTETETKPASGKAPTYIAYQVRDGNEKGFFTRIGAAWAHKDGKGFNVQLDSVPLNGRITLRLPSETK